MDVSQLLHGHLKWDIFNPHHTVELDSRFPLSAPATFPSSSPTSSRSSSISSGTSSVSTSTMASPHHDVVMSRTSLPIPEAEVLRVEVVSLTPAHTARPTVSGPVISVK